MSLEILFGSQTGTAEDVSERFCAMARSTGIECRVRSLDLINSIDDFTSNLLFVVATTGDGEEPDNMKEFWRFIMRKSLSTTPNILSHVRYALIGLGDSTYPKFNFVGKKLSKRLEQLGAEMICEKVLADEQHPHGIDGCIDQFFTNIFWKSFGELIGRDLKPNLGQRLSSKFQIQWIETTNNDLSTIADGFTNVSLVSNTRLTSDDHFQDVRLIEFETNLSYRCGDVAMILPENPSDLIELLVELLNVRDRFDRHFIAKNETRTISMSVEQLFRQFLDICRVPSRSFFEKLLWFADDERERERLAEFLLPESVDDLYTYCHRPRRTGVEVLQDFPQTARRIPFEYVFDLFRPIRPRSFSIASSSRVHVNRVQLLVAVVRYKTLIARPRQGLCSTFLSNLQLGDQVRMKISSSFNLIDDERPAIMIGPGTGVAPFRGWILQRNLDQNFDNLLFFGCRYKNKDAFVEKDLQNDSTKLIYIAAYSRDQPEKIYVQHKIIEYGQIVWDWISNREARIYLAGSAKQVPEQVIEALKNVFVRFGSMNDDEAERFFKELERTKRFQRETWS